MATATLPLAARAARTPCLALQDVDGVAYDETLQLNLTADGTPWHTTPQAASCTDTNLDGQGDDTSDPYYAKAA